MRIQVWTDFVCPFCYIGNEKLKRAIQAFEHHDQIEVEFKSYQLDPHARYEEGKTMAESLSETKGMPQEQLKQMTEHLTTAAEEVNLTFRFDIAKNANTFDAHRLYQYAKSIGKGSSYTERVKKAYFTEGEVISDYNTLVKLAEEVGISKEDSLSVLQSTAYSDDVKGDIEQARQIGIQGVPFFIFNNRYAISGSQPQELFAKTLETAWAEQ